MAWVSLCTLDELTADAGKYVEVDGFRLAVFLHAGQVSVLDSTCPHAGANLADGPVQDGCAVCPRHAWAFRLDNGQLQNAPGVAVQKYVTRLHSHGGREFVQAELPTY
jgi:nitrite reductase (NADH) small subunit/3-phenylpropionate/trans-cinnamate dioxygenase ferredoxin subunit